MKGRRRDGGEPADLELPREAPLLSSTRLDRKRRELLVDGLRLLFTPGTLASLVPITSGRVLDPFRREPLENATGVVISLQAATDPPPET